ncbi:MAG: DUF1572 family protein [Gemmatimonadetes bacterium]|nr:DUF1572 family protein [Gemmatimonadota bacterium]
MTRDVASHYLQDMLLQLSKQKQLAERAFEQLADDEMFFQLDPESNSIAVIIRHLAGNMRSRWTDFLTSDGEKADRQRDTEFEIQPGIDRGTVMEWWEEGWSTLFAALEPLEGGDLLRTVSIRGEPHSVLEAINRQLTHYANHVGQIVYVARHVRGSEWRSLSIPRGQSQTFDVTKDGGSKRL